MNTRHGHKNPGNKPGETIAGEELTGTVETVVFRSEDTGYTVCSIQVPGHRDTVTVVGNCPTIWIGETIRATGEWVRHRRHGNQFQAKAMQCIAPTSAKGIERYLSSGMIRGIGKVNAQRLVRAFGEDTLRIIEKESKRLEEVEGIGPGRRRMIKESWNEQKAVRDIMIFLQSHGVGTAQGARIFKQYGNDAISIITDNPYRLCEDIWGIGFKTADSVATSIGIPHDSPTRARAGIAHVLAEMSDEGHCYCPEPELLLQAEALLGIPVETLTTALNHEIRRGVLARQNDRIYLTALLHAECAVAQKMKSLLNTPAGFKPIDAARATAWAENRMNISFAPQQTEALKMALSSKVSIITGGPGVGKTTIIRALVDVFKARKLEVALAAPTGRASKRMEEATRCHAATIHRLLKFLPGPARFEHGPDNPVEGDVFILDEVSMIDIRLMSSFMSALTDRSCLVLVGDVDQLPSVGPGNVLKDMIESESIPCTRLNEIFRQQSRGWIVQNAHRVNSGRKLISPDGGEEADFYFLHTDDPDQVLERMVQLVAERIPSRFNFDPVTDIQVLTPMRKNQLGADNLNHVLQQRLNPSGTEIMRFGRKYRMGDRVMQIRNNYDKEVFNGDIGRIARVDELDQNVEVNFDGRCVKYGFMEMDELAHAYACSIHKAQGSEYPAVVILMATQHFRLLQRNLLYTAITRGRELVCVIGSHKAVNIAIANNKTKLRRTSLRERLSERCVPAPD